MNRTINRLNFTGKRLLSAMHGTIYNVNLSLFGRKFLIKRAQKRFRKKMGRSFDWDNPQTINEIVTRNKVMANTPLWTELADKDKVKEYVKSKGLESILIETYGVWDRAKDIDFSALPSSFVIKPTNGCAKYMIVKDKSTLDEQSTRDRLSSWLHNRFGFRSVEPHYLRIKPRIIIEELLTPSADDELQAMSLVDYKWYCFNGHATYALVASNRGQKAHTFQVSMYDTQWVNHSHFVKQKSDNATQVPKPKCLDEMIRVCEILSKDIPFVRVDLYEVNEAVYFGEMTLSPAAGHSPSHTYEFDCLMGEAYRQYNP